MNITLELKYGSSELAEIQRLSHELVDLDKASDGPVRVRVVIGKVEFDAYVVLQLDKWDPATGAEVKLELVGEVFP